MLKRAFLEALEFLVWNAALLGKEEVNRSNGVLTLPVKNTGNSACDRIKEQGNSQ